LFDQRPAVVAEEPEEHPLVAALRDLQPDELSPKEALERLYQLSKNCVRITNHIRKG